MLRYNSDLDIFEGYIGPNTSSAWRPIGPIGSSSATFTNITVTGVASINSLLVSNGMNGTLGAITPLPAIVTTFTSSGLATFSNTVTLTSNTTANALGTGALVIAGTGGASVGGNLFVGGYISVDELRITGTKQSTAPNNGALTVAGGVGIGKNLNVGGNGVITENFSAVNTQTNSYMVRGIPISGVPNEGTHKGYLLLAKAHVSGLQPVSYVTGDFVFKRGSDGSNNRTDIYRVMSSSGYSTEEFTVQVQAGGLSFFVRTVKINYVGVIYHAIETTTTGGIPDNGILFYGSAVNAGLMYVDATFITAPTAFGTHTYLDHNGNLTIIGNITAYSDTRLKKNIKVIDHALEKVNQLSGYTFDRIDLDTGRQTGVIAQEVLAVLPEAVTENTDGIYSVSYGNMVGLLIESIKELTQQVTDLQAQLQAIKK
jgi:hypothetical protein